MGEGTRTWQSMSSRAGGSKPPLEPETPGDHATFRHDASVQRLASDKIVLLKAELEERLRSGKPEHRICGFLLARAMMFAAMRRRSRWIMTVVDGADASRVMTWREFVVRRLKLSALLALIGLAIVGARDPEH